jgi:hypothetical protein
MARDVKVIYPRDFVSARADGCLDLEESEHLLREVARVSDLLREFDILVDTREAASSLSATDLWFLADKLTKYPKTFGGRTAILCPAERCDHAAFFALCAENKGVDMQAFISYEEAMAWLQGATSQPAGAL